MPGFRRSPYRHSRRQGAPRPSPLSEEDAAGAGPTPTRKPTSRPTRSTAPPRHLDSPPPQSRRYVRRRAGDAPAAPRHGPSGQVRRCCHCSTATVSAGSMVRVTTAAPKNPEHHDCPHPAIQLGTGSRINTSGARPHRVVIVERMAMGRRRASTARSPPPAAPASACTLHGTVHDQDRVVHHRAHRDQRPA